MSVADTPHDSAPRTVYDDPDDTHAMAENASACRAEAHLARFVSTVSAQVPSTLLAAPRKATKVAFDVTDAAARFATRLLD